LIVVELNAFKVNWILYFVIKVKCSEIKGLIKMSKHFQLHDQPWEHNYCMSQGLHVLKC